MESIQAAEPEVALSRERVADLLAAVGNHEIKALVLTAMSQHPGQSYTSRALESIMREVVGSDQRIPVHRVFYEYCSESLVPIGLVAKMKVSQRTEFQATTEGITIGKAIAGHVLDLSLKHPETSLRRLLGMTSSGNPEHGRTPAMRAELLTQLLTSPDVMSVKELIEVAGINHRSAYSQIDSLEKDGIIEGRKVTGEHVYEIAESLPEFPSLRQQGDRIEMRRNIDALIKEISKQDDRRVTVKGIARMLNAGDIDDRDYVENVRDRMKLLIQVGILKLIKENDIHNRVVRINPKMTGAVNDVCHLVSDLEKPSPDFLQDGWRKADRIINDPSAVAELVSKALANSPQASALPYELKIQRIREVARTLPPGEGLSPRQYAKLINDPLMTPRAIQKALIRLRANGDPEIGVVYQKGTTNLKWGILEAEAGATGNLLASVLGWVK